MKRTRPLAAACFLFFSAPVGAVEGTDTGANILTLPQAIELAIKNNLTTKLARAATEEARGRTLQAAAALLPHITGVMQQQRIFKENLEALGFPADSTLFAPLLGPYNVFDARLQLAQTLLDFSSIWVREAARSSEKAAAAQERLAREQVAIAAALAYFEAQRANRAVAAAQADLTLSQSLLKLAQDQHKAGVSTGVDVARAETDEAQEHLRLIRDQVAARDADLRLKRVVGLPLDQPLALPDIPRAASMEIPAAEKIIDRAENDRAEVQVALETMKLSNYGLRAAESGYAPTIKATADYGFSGNVPEGSARTGSIGGRLDLPIFSGGETHGLVAESRARQDEAQARYDDIRTQVEEDVRLSLQTMKAEVEETETADKAVALARTELKMARDRFAAGVGDNIQLLSAQTVLARALDDQVDAFARYDTARANLATALGHMQEFSATETMADPPAK